MRAYALILSALLGVFPGACREAPRPPALPYGQMQEGDLAFRCGQGVFSRMVTTAEEDGTYSHVGVLVRHDGEWKVVHAVPGEKESARDFDRVKEESAERFFAPDRACKGCLVHVVPLERDRVEEMRQTALRLAADSVRFDSRYNLEDSSRVYCTELVWRLYRQAGVDLSEGRRRWVKLFDIQADCILPEHLFAYSGNEVYFTF